MRISQHLRKKASLESASTPVPNQLQTRSFGKGIQARQSGLPATNLLQTRPFGKGNQASSQQQEKPNIQTQLEQAEHFGYNAANIPVLAPGTSSPSAMTHRIQPKLFDFGDIIDTMSKGVEVVVDALKSVTTIKLEGSVGRGGKNKTTDVVTIQQRLSGLGFLTNDASAAERPTSETKESIPEDSLSATIAAIEHYQSEVVKLSSPDGRVDPGGKTLKALSAWTKATEDEQEVTPKPEPETPSPTTDQPSPAIPSTEIEKTIASLKNPATDAIVSDLERMASTKQEITKKNEETGQGRDALINDIVAVRQKISTLSAAELNVDAATLQAIQSHFYKKVAQIAPYYTQTANANILSKSKTEAWKRTCNITTIGMTLEGLGKSTSSFTGNIILIGNIAKYFEGALQEKEADASNVTSLRFPDFLQLVAIYIALTDNLGLSSEELNQKAQSDPVTFGESVDKARAIAAGMVTYSSLFNKFTQLFGVKATSKTNSYNTALSAFGAFTRGVQAAVKDKKNKGKKPEEISNAVREYFVSETEKDKTKLETEIETLKEKLSATSGKSLKKFNKKIATKERQLAKKQELLEAYQATESPAKMNEILPLASYKASVLSPMSNLLGSGKQVIVNLHNHFVRLEAINEENIVVDDPGSRTKKNMDISWEDARALGYFKRYTILE
ncbi:MULTISPECIES: hypothetical protein [unclassified Coleofasciculus]|uniref:hypothetical protein n=1 Tax=unclassified Coleofasciculus TaxID=2692782 RepID=UPI0018827C64|nr:MULTISPECIES: hypothetical protein [unclassified Coleofasciculus]MBE9129619.1 hypothetical protein [Coleofasciculus sp. LEGE 07081]MBE9152153.1 hypothetical protein [Coleofasciculus sp. LEGE 07092]